MRALEQPGLISKRKVIAVKGYQHDIWGGRALVAIEALKLVAPYLKGYEVVVYPAQPNSEVSLFATEVFKNSGVRLTLMGQAPHDEIVKLMGRSRVAIGLSVSDGTP